MPYVVDKAAIERAIDTMTPVDAMSDKPALTTAYNVWRHTNAKIKHIILLSDGNAEDSNYRLVTQIHKAGITISTVATGGGTSGFGADYGTMQNIVRFCRSNPPQAAVRSERIDGVGAVLALSHRRETSGFQSTAHMPESHAVTGRR